MATSIMKKTAATTVNSMSVEPCSLLRLVFLFSNNSNYLFLIRHVAHPRTGTKRKVESASGHGVKVEDGRLVRIPSDLNVHVFHRGCTGRRRRDHDLSGGQIGDNYRRLILSTTPGSTSTHHNIFCRGSAIPHVWNSRKITGSASGCLSERGVSVQKASQFNHS